MSKPTLARIFVSVMTLIVALAVSACGGATPERLREATEEPAAITSVVGPTATQTSEVEIKPTSTIPPLPTATSTPLPSPTASLPPQNVEALELIDQGFGQNNKRVGYSFLVKNPNSDFAFQDTQYQVTLYDDAGTVIGTDIADIHVILPGQTLGVASTLYLDEGMNAAKIVVQLQGGEPVATESAPTFTVASVVYYAGEYGEATGVINNPYAVDLQDIYVSAVAYNNDGEIVGGGFTFLNFILANGSAGVQVNVVASRDVATVELYPTVTRLTSLSKETKLPDGANKVKLIKQGFGQADQQVGFGMLVENPNGNFAIRNTLYHVTAFAEDGRVLGAEQGEMMLSPNQTLGIAESIFLGEDTEVARVDAKILTGDFVDPDLQAFTTENVTYQPDDYSPQVTGEIVSPYDKDITDVLVSAILYNEAGEIIGGGQGWSFDPVPANGKVAVEVSVQSSGDPARAELYATATRYSEFQ